VTTLPAKKFFSRIIRIQFLTAFSWAVISVVFPLLLKKEFGSDRVVSLIFTSFYGVSLITFLVCVPLVKKMHQRRSFDITLLLMPFIALLLGFATNKWELVVIYVIFTFLSNIYSFNLNLYFPRLQRKEKIMESAGRLGAIYNAAWVVGPLLGGLLADHFGVQPVFFASALFAIFAFLQLPINGMPRAYLGEGLTNPWNGIKKYFSDRSRTQAFINGLGIDFIYGSWFLVPILMMELGASLTEIGLITALASIPWVLLEIPIGKAADRKIASRTMFIVGYLTLAVAKIFMGFTGNILIFSVFYLIAVVGSCFIEQTNTPYLLKMLEKRDNALISIYLIKAPLGRMISPLLASFLLTFAPLRFVVTIFGCITLLFVLNAVLLKTKGLVAQEFTPPA